MQTPGSNFSLSGAVWFAGRCPHTATWSTRLLPCSSPHPGPGVTQEMREERNEGMCPGALVAGWARARPASRRAGSAVSVCQREGMLHIGDTAMCPPTLTTPPHAGHYATHTHLHCFTPGHLHCLTNLHLGSPALEEILWESSGPELAQLGVCLVTLLFISVKSHPQKLLCGRKPAVGIIVGFDSRRFGSISWLHMKCACSEHPFSNLFDH